MRERILIDGTWSTLTTEHAASSHGQPVLVCDLDRVARAPAETCRLRVEDASDEAVAALSAAGYEFDDCRD